jgi:hypothetical protein
MAKRFENTLFNIRNIPTLDATVKRVEYDFEINYGGDFDTGDEIYFKFKLYTDPESLYHSEEFMLYNFTASFYDKAEAVVYSTTPAVGYKTVSCDYFASASMSTDNNKRTIIFNPGISGFHNNNHRFEPNPEISIQNGTNFTPLPTSSLLSKYGAVEYDFEINPYDIILIYLQDDTFIEYRVLKAEKINSLLHITLDKDMSDIVENNIAGELYKRFLILKRVPDETNLIITFQKTPGQTSYGFAVPNDLDNNILKNINIITKEVQQKLLADQQGTVTT